MDSPLTPTPPNINPDDVAEYLLWKRLKHTDHPETVRSVVIKIEADPKVRAFVEQLELLDNPLLDQPYPPPSSN
jgi:hypothetical protein